MYEGVIPPHGTVDVPFTGQEAQSGLLHSIVVTGNGPPGTFQAKLVSRITGSLYEVELLAKNALDLNNSGVHPWSVDQDTESHIVLFNHTAEAKKAGVFISSQANLLWQHEFMLTPFETREISINDLQRHRTKNDGGKLLPDVAKDGVVTWMTPNSGDVTGRLMVTNRNTSMARNFSCGNYAGACSLSFGTNFSSIGTDDDLGMYNANASLCSYNPNGGGTCRNGTPIAGVVNYSWSIGDSSIITLSSADEQGKNSPLLHGVSAGNGTATVHASAG